MDISSFIFPLIKNSEKFRKTIEGITGQPVDYVLSKFNSFIDELGKGPGIVDEEKVRKETFEKMYEYGINMGFQPWESEIAAAGIAGYSPVQIAVTFNHRGWKTSAEEIERMGKEIAPRYREAGIKYGIFKDESSPNQKESNNGIPDINSSDGGTEPPWKNNNNASETGSN